MFDETFKDKSELKVGNPEIVETSTLEVDLPEQFEVLSIIGQGGMGTVYKCRNKYTERTVAIKVLQGKFDEIAGKRFQQEARAAGALVHENAVTVYDFGITAMGMPYLVMECLDGQSLSSLIEELSILPESLVAEIFVGVCAALEAAHNRGIIHRDIKPSNLVVLKKADQSTSVKVLDFGIAKILEDEKNQGVTKTGEVFGSPLYMSPEQCAGNSTDLRSDIYSVGASMYECLLGTPPHVGTNAMQTIFKRATEDPPTFTQTRPDLRLSPTLEAIVMKAISRDPALRYSSVADLKTDLAIFLDSAASSSSASPPSVKSSLGKNSSLASSSSSRKPQNGGIIPRTRLMVFFAIAMGMLLVAGVLIVKDELEVTKPKSDIKAITSNSSPDLTLDRLKFDGEVAFNQKRYPEAIAKFKEALAYVEKNKLDDAQSLLLLHDKLSRAYQWQNDVVGEASELRSAIPLSKDPSQLANLKCRLGHNYLFSDKVEACVPLLQDSLKLSKGLQEHIQTSVTLNEITFAYLVLHKYKDCIEACTNEIEELRYTGNKAVLFLATAYERRANSYLALHDYLAAERDSKEAIKILGTLDPNITKLDLDSARETLIAATRALKH